MVVKRVRMCCSLTDVSSRRCLSEDKVNARAVWVVAERDEEGLRETTFEILEEGRKLADQLEDRLCCVLIGHQVGESIETLGRYGVDTIYVVEHPLLAEYNTDGYTAALTELIRNHKPYLVIMSATPNGQDLAPRLAARLKIGLVTDCVMLKLSGRGEVLFIKPTHQDKVYATITCPSTTPHLATIRPGAIGIAPPNYCRQPEVISWEPCIHSGMLRTRTLDLIKGDPKLIDVGEAEFIVSGGRGVDGMQGWQLIEGLAEILGASVGGTRMAMDMGYIPQERMIGQTGKAVGPKLYLAAGISGASHHVGGIDAECMIAINTDRNAPIFSRCDLGIIGDLHEVLPALTRKLRQMKDTDS